MEAALSQKQSALHVRVMVMACTNTSKKDLRLVINGWVRKLIMIIHIAPPHKRSELSSTMQFHPHSLSHITIFCNDLAKMPGTMLKRQIVE